jgi:hypothetical protein
MADQVKYLGVLLEKKFDWKDVQSVHCLLAMSSRCGQDLRSLTKSGALAIHFCGEVHFFVVSLQEKIGLRDLQIWMRQISLFSLWINFFVVAELICRRFF